MTVSPRRNKKNHFGAASTLVASCSFLQQSLLPFVEQQHRFFSYGLQLTAHNSKQKSLHLLHQKRPTAKQRPSHPQGSTTSGPPVKPLPYNPSGGASGSQGPTEGDDQHHGAVSYSFPDPVDVLRQVQNLPAGSTPEEQATVCANVMTVLMSV
ncbi:unnamed protein product [Amoebophrya sp. A120]|nr:unnamed protein product [Amoebophrya sp. A120]|eukprot:GSA120T00013960001.1